MVFEHYDLSGLPGIVGENGYEYFEGFPKNVRLKNGEKIRVNVPIQHIAYNIILPKICKAIDSENFREKIRYRIPGVILTEKEETAAYSNDEDRFNENDEDYGSSRKIAIRKSEINHGKLTSFICAEAGHALSVDVYGIPNICDMVEYYDYVAQKIGEKIFSQTRFSFKTESEIELADEKYEKLIERKGEDNYCLEKMKKQLIKTAEKTTPGEIKKLKECYEDMTLAKANLESIIEICEINCEMTHARGYAMAEIMHKNFGDGAFMHFDDIFTSRDRKIVLRPYLEKKIPKIDSETLRKTLNKIDYIHREIERGYPKAHENHMNIVREYLENMGIEPCNPYLEG